MSGAKDWDKELAIVMFAYNNTPNVSTGFTPFMLNLGYEPMMPLNEAEVNESPAAQEVLANLESKLAVAKDNLE